jgi:hypothetical protein
MHKKLEEAQVKDKGIIFDKIIAKHFLNLRKVIDIYI